MSHVRLLFGIPSGIKNVPDTLLVSVRNLAPKNWKSFPTPMPIRSSASSPAFRQIRLRASPPRIAKTLSMPDGR